MVVTADDVFRLRLECGPDATPRLQEDIKVLLKRIGIVVAGVAAAVLFFGSAASAHECFIASRSEKGDVAATNSARWTPLTVADIAQFIAPPGTDQDCFIEFWLANGGPESITIRSDKTIGEGSNNPNLANGKGLEHASQVFGGLLEAAVAACSP